MADLRAEVAHLRTATELARALEVVPSAVHNWRKRHADFPTPVIDRSRLTLWDEREVRAWYVSPDRLSTAHRSTRGKALEDIYGPAEAARRRVQARADLRRKAAKVPPHSSGGPPFLGDPPIPTARGL